MPDSASKKGPVFYSHNDLTSDYYQVLAEKGRPKVCKLFWALVTFGFLIITGYMVYNLLSEYFEFSSYNKESISWLTKLPLPAITICSTNYLNYTHFLEEVNDTDTLEDIEYLYKQLAWYNGTGGIMTWVNWTDIQDLDSDIIGKNGEKLSLFDDFRFWPQQFLLGDGYNHPIYKFGGIWQTLNWTSETGSHKLGQCLNLNDDESLVQVVAGKYGGLTIDLDAKIADYFPATTTKGFEIYLRNPNETVLIDKGGILVTPGTENFLSLEKSEVQSLSAPYGTCVNVTSKFHSTTLQTVRECLQEDWFYNAVWDCECMPWFLLDRLDELSLTDYRQVWYDRIDEARLYSTSNTSGDTCGFASQAVCDIRVLEYMTKNANETNCPEPCNFDEYDWSLMSAQFPPSEAYFNMLLNDTLSLYGNYTYTYAQNNLIRLHIYYEDIRKKNIVQEKAYEFFNFVAELGGTVDLLIGFSFFTVFQLFEIGIAYIVFRFCRKEGSEKKAEVVVESVESVESEDARSVIASLSQYAF